MRAIGVILCPQCGAADALALFALEEDGSCPPGQCRACGFLLPIDINKKATGFSPPNLKSLLHNHTLF